MKKVPCIVFPLLLLSAGIQAQTPQAAMRQKMIDSIKMAMIGEYAKTYPILRQVIVYNDFIGTTRSYTDYQKNRVLSGKLLTNRTQALVNLPLAAWKKNVINLNMNYSHQYIRYTDRELLDRPVPEAAPNQDLHTNTYGASLSWAHTDSLLGLPISTSLTANALTGKSNAIQKFSAMGNLVFTLKRTATTAIAVGGVVLIDPSLNVPFIPVFSYWHRFPGKLELIIDLPQRAVLRRAFNHKCWATLGTEIASSVAFLNLSPWQLPQETNFSTFELKNGITFEHMLSRKMIAGISAGVFTTVSSRFFSTDQKSNDYFISNKNNATPYLNVSLSFLPFTKALIR